VGANGAGETVLAYLTRRYRHSSGEVWARRIASGEVLRGTVAAGATDVLRAGDALVWRRPPWEEPAVPLAFAILYRDSELLAVAKPRGLPAVPAGGFLTHTLLHLVRERFPEATPLHRLGRGTSGILLFARTDSARRVLSAAWRRGEVEKTYRAWVTGIPERLSFVVDAPIGPVPHPRLGWVHAASGEGKASVTRVRCVGESEGNAIVDVEIPTGRPHQIRIHMAVAGHPLVGDPVYVAGGRLAETPSLPGDPGYWLHAHRLRFTHPITGLGIELECSPPPRLRVRP